MYKNCIEITFPDMLYYHIISRGNIKIENSYKATIRFLWNSRLFKTFADKLYEKWNKKLQIE